MHFQIRSPLNAFGMLYWNLHSAGGQMQSQFAVAFIVTCCSDLLRNVTPCKAVSPVENWNLTPETAVCSLWIFNTRYFCKIFARLLKTALALHLLLAHKMEVTFWCFVSDLSVVCGLSLNRSQDEFVISEENLDESEDDPPSNEDSDSEFCARISRRHLSRPMRQSRRLRRKTVKKKYSEDDEEEDSEDNSSRESGEYQ